MYNFGLINTWLGVILPQLIAPVAVIAYKQFFDWCRASFAKQQCSTVLLTRRSSFVFLPPDELGSDRRPCYHHVHRRVECVLWPFLAVTTEPMMNVAVAMGANFTALGENYLAASLLAGLPVALVYLLFQRRVTQAVMLSSGLSSR